MPVAEAFPFFCQRSLCGGARICTIIKLCLIIRGLLIKIKGYVNNHSKRSKDHEKDD